MASNRYSENQMPNKTVIDVTIYLLQICFQAQALEQILREAYSHPAVQGIIMWTAWHPGSCYRMCLTDNNFKNLATGDVVDKLIAEWKSAHVVGTTDADGYFEAQLFHGEYDMSLKHITADSSVLQSLVVDTESQQDIVIQADV